MPPHTRLAAMRPASQGASPSEKTSRRPIRAKRNPTEEHGSFGQKYIAGVPARFMRPRLVFIACLIALVLFGLLMVYSASSVEALKEEGDSLYFLKRQAIFVAIGSAAAAVLATGRLGVPGTALALPVRVTRWRSLLVACWWIICGLLIMVKLFGHSSGGASRWIKLGAFTLQPSEFAKPLIILVVATLFEEYFHEQSLSLKDFLVRLLCRLAVPLFLTVIQPDYGTTLIIGVTVFAMALLSGLPLKNIASIAVPIAVGVAIYGLGSGYRLQRLAMSMNPWSDPYDTTYQAAISIMAFASGGVFGRGIGGSTMKYSYLPEAHNDYILAIIGEELGYVGTIIFFAVFATLIVSALAIAWRSPTMQGRLIAGGCGVILGVQFLINVLGILNVTPMTGKPLPFISYGGSSIISCLILAGLIIRVSVESAADTDHDVARRSLDVVGAMGQVPTQQDDVSSHLGRSTAGVPHRRSDATARRSCAYERGFSVYDGGRRADGQRGRVPVSERSGGYERVNLGAREPGDRLRTDGVRYRGRRDDQDGWGRGRHDR